MREFDEMRALQLERDGVRTVSGHHIATVEAEACPAAPWPPRCVIEVCDDPAASQGFCLTHARMFASWARLNWWDV